MKAPTWNPAIRLRGGHQLISFGPLHPAYTALQSFFSSALASSSPCSGPSTEVVTTTQFLHACSASSTSLSPPLQIPLTILPSPQISATLTHLTSPPSTTTTKTTTTTATSPSSSPPHSPPANPSTPPAPALTLEIAESLRLLERKVASVYTLLKASVYSIVLQQGEGEGEGDTTQGSAGGGVGDDGGREGVEW